MKTWEFIEMSDGNEESHAHCNEGKAAAPCVNCSPEAYTLSRLDIWNTAKGALKDAQLDYDADDVVALSLFLAGETFSSA